MSLSLELPRGAQERCMGVEIIVSQMPGSCSRNGQRSDSPLCKKWLNKAGFFRLEKKQQKMDKMCLQEARREGIEVNCSLFVSMQVQGHIKRS